MLRKLGALKEGREILRDEDTSSLVKVWLALEVRQFIHASIQDVRIHVSLLRNTNVLSQMMIFCSTNNTNNYRSTLLSKQICFPPMHDDKEYMVKYALNAVQCSLSA